MLYFIPVGEYLDEWSRIHLNEDLINREFKEIVNPNYERIIGTNEKNLTKNRYDDIQPYDQNRVKLLQSQDDSDYYNASFIKDYNGDLKFIAAQAPLENTVTAFWSIVVEQNVNAIVTLTDIDPNAQANKSKCYPYWNDENEIKFGKYTIACVSKENCGDWVERTLNLKTDDGSQIKSIRHFHYTEWPDKNVPDKKSLVRLIDRVRSLYTRTDWPILVHCLAGVGRTGTFICLEQLIDMADSFGCMYNVKSFIKHMRHQRVDLVETVSQYKFIHDTLMERYNSDVQALSHQ